MKKNEKDGDKTESFLRVFAGAIVGFVVLCLVAAFCVCLPGCASTSGRNEPRGIRESSAYIIGQLDQSIEEFDRGLRVEVERSRTMENEIQRLSSLFRAYEQAALRLRDEVDRIRNEGKDALENSDSPSDR